MKLFLEFMNTSCPEQSLLQTSLEYLQLEIRIGTPVLQSDFTEWGHLATSCWLKHLWSFVSLAQLQLIPNQPKTFPLQCKGDACIMDRVWALHPTPHQLATFNHCCMAHRGPLAMALHPFPLAHLATSSWSWPRAAMAKDNWLTWQHFLPWLATVTVLGIWISPPPLVDFYPFQPHFYHSIPSSGGTILADVLAVYFTLDETNTKIIPLSNCSQPTARYLLICMHPSLVWGQYCPFGLSAFPTHSPTSYLCSIPTSNHVTSQLP